VSLPNTLGTDVLGLTADRAFVWEARPLSR
jgi:hypothetical protein